MADEPNYEEVDEGLPEDMKPAPPAEQAVDDKDPRFVQPDATAEELLEATEEIQDRARRTFSLRDRLAGIKHQETKVLVFTDMEVEAEYANIQNRIAFLENAAARYINTKDAAEEAQRDSLLAQVEDLQPKREAVLEKMMDAALSIHMRAFPNIALKAARGQQRRKFQDESGVIPAERIAEANEWIDNKLLGDCIIGIFDRAGHPMDLGPRDELGKLLSETLPPAQWARVYNAYQALILTDQIGALATDDPGF
jgi:hypothetical protein